MNTKVRIVIILTVVALIILTIYTFGPQASVKSGKHNPASLKPDTPVDTIQANLQKPLAVYHNKDKRENYYTIGFPQDWKTSAGKPGTYISTFVKGSCSVILMDVPDNTTLELYILSQDEPRLRKAYQDYKRIDYKKIVINKIETYQLQFQYQSVKGPMECLTTYFSGADNAGVILFNTGISEYPKLAGTFESIINTFQWELK